MNSILCFQGLLQQIRSLIPKTEDNSQLSLLEEKFKRKEPRVESVENHLWKNAVWVDVLAEGEKSYCAVCFFFIEVLLSVFLSCVAVLTVERILGQFQNSSTFKSKCITIERCDKS